jgi:hypothetical protein
VNEDGREDEAIGSGLANDAEIDGLSKQVGAIATTSAKSEVGEAGRKTADTLKSGERIASALEIWEEETDMFKVHQDELQKWDAKKERLLSGDTKLTDDQMKEIELEKPKLPARNPYIIASRLDSEIPEAYVLHVIEGVRSSDLEQSLLTLSFTNVMMFLNVIAVWIEKVCSKNLR